MKKFLYITLLLSLTNICFSQELLVPFFPQLGIVTIKSDFASKNNWYSQYSDFREAKLFLLPSKEFALEIFYYKQDSLWKERQILTYSQKTSYVDSLQKSIPLTLPQLTLDQKGKIHLLVGSSLVGLAYYGTASAIVADSHSDSYKMPLAAYMFGAASGILLPYYITKNNEITIPQASMVFHGQSRGILHGIGLAHSLVKNPNLETSLLFGMGISIGEGVGNYFIAKKQKLTMGQASMYQFGIDAGFLGGVLISDIAGLMENDKRQAIWSTVVGTSLVGGATGLYFSKQDTYTTGDAVILRSSMALGALIPMPFINYFETKGESKPYTFGMLAGGIGGAVLGNYLIKNNDYSLGSGMYMVYSEIAGGLLGLGTGFLLAPENNDKAFSNYLLTSATIGTLAGYGGMYWFLQKNTPKSTSIHIDFDLNPMALYFNKKQSSYYNKEVVLPVATCRMQF